MYINHICHYLPDKILDNVYFADKTGLSLDELFKKAGIMTRVCCGEDENSTTMAINAVENCKGNYPFPLDKIDLIIGASYTPYDTIGTVAHAVQRHFNIQNAKALFISSACSSFVNAMEIIQGYYGMGKSDFSLVLATEHNTRFADPTDAKAGHLWGDAAAAVFISRNKLGNKSLKVLDIMSAGLGNIGKGPEAVTLRPMDDGLRMYYGKDVFINAIEFMTYYIKEIVTKNGFSMNDINYVVPHQANVRIINQIAKNLDYNEDKILMNIQKYGNTGCASTPLLLSENWDRFKFGDLIALTVFGGGYSAGAILLRVV